MAETCTVAFAGTLAGAVYIPEVVVVPDAALPPATPLTFQVTAGFEAPLTVAVNCWVASGDSSAEVGEIEIETALGAGGGGAEPAAPPPQPMPAVAANARKRPESRKRKEESSHRRGAEFGCSLQSRDAARWRGGCQGHKSNNGLRGRQSKNSLRQQTLPPDLRNSEVSRRTGCKPSRARASCRQWVRAGVRNFPLAE